MSCAHNSDPCLSILKETQETLKGVMWWDAVIFESEISYFFGRNSLLLLTQHWTVLAIDVLF